MLGPVLLSTVLSFHGSTLPAVNVQTNGGMYYTAVLNSGPVAQKYDIVFIGDGFTSSDQAAFNAAVDDALAALQGLPPYSQRMCAFNIWRVNVVSSESGVDHPAQGVFRNTELDCRFGNPSNGEAERCITSDSPLKCIEAADYAPDHDAIFVLVNDTEWGGCAGGLVFSSIAPGFHDIITHELGHKIGALADEYDCYVCDGSDNDRSYSGAEPMAVNLTKDTNRTTTKWSALIASTTAIPTTVNSPPGVVGLWEGGGYFRFGIYRPQSSCHMRDLAPFCAVCADAMLVKLQGRCTLCELNPSSYFCWSDDWRPIRPIRWDRLRDIRWPLPPCLQCPPEVFFDDVDYVLSGAPAGFKLYVRDQAGAVVAEGRQTPTGIEARFQASRADQYTFELVGGENPQEGTLMLRSSLTRNGRLEER